MMTADDVIAITGRLAAADVTFWLDGGWAVDALIGEQSRDHDDLDLVVKLNQADRLIETLSAAGFAVTLDERPTRFVVADASDRRIDLHPVVFEADGSARQIGAGPNGGDAIFRPSGFTGVGSIGEQFLPCLSARLLVLFHTGYTPQEKDWHNVRLLTERFGINVPDSFSAFNA